MNLTRRCGENRRGRETRYNRSQTHHRNRLRSILLLYTMSTEVNAQCVTSQIKSNADKPLPADEEVSSDTYYPVMDVSPDYKKNKKMLAGGEAQQSSKEEIDFQFVQDFNKNIRRSNNNPQRHQEATADGRQKPQIFTLSFDHAQNFIIEFGTGDNNNTDHAGVIMSGGGSSSKKNNKHKKPWLQIVRPTESDGSEELVVTNMKREPFLMIKEGRCDESGDEGTALDLYRHNPLNYRQKDPICKVRRKFCKKVRRFNVHLADVSYRVGYFVELLGPLAHHYPAVECEGQWPNSMRFIHFLDNNDDAGGGGEQTTSATIQKQLFRNNKWELNVSAGQDIILFIGITCALDLLDRKAKERRRENRQARKK